MRARRSQLLLVALIGCSSTSASVEREPVLASGMSPSAPTTEAEDSEQVSEEPPSKQLLRVFSVLEGKMQTPKSSCTKFNDELRGWLDGYGDEIRDLLILDHSDAEHEQIDQAINDVATLVVFGAAECGGHDGAMASYDEFDALVL